MNCPLELSADELDVVSNAQRGERAAIEVLINRYRPMALILAQRFLRRDAAEDAVQDAIVLALNSISNLQDPARFGAWFSAIVRNRCRRIARQSPELEISLDPYLVGESQMTSVALTVPPPPPPNIELRMALRKLPESTRNIVQLHYLEGWSVAELATFLSLPVTTIKWQLHAGRALLRRMMDSKEILGR